MHEKRAQAALLQSKLHALAAKTASSESAQAGGPKPPAPAPKRAIKKLGGKIHRVDTKFAS
jgi:hypothetical protein